MHLYNNKIEKKICKEKQQKIRNQIFGYYYNSKILNNDKISDKIIISKSWKTFTFKTYFPQICYLIS